MSGYADVLSREESYFRQPLTDQGVPALLKSQGGPFAAVAANVRRLSQATNQLWLASAQSTRGKGSKTDTRWDHDIMAVILWTASSGETADQDQVALHAAADKVVRRIAGPPGDRGHGGRWWMVGPVTVAPPNPLQVLTWQDMLGALGVGYVLTVMYRCSEWTTG